jgi:hypothetical protein
MDEVTRIFICTAIGVVLVFALALWEIRTADRKTTNAKTRERTT